MRRWITTMVGAMTVSVAVTGFGIAADAQAAPVNPADALRRQLVEDRGVTMSEITTTWTDGKKHRIRDKTRAEFGDGGVIATDFTHGTGSDASPFSVRFLTFKGRLYCRGWICPASGGKTWVLSDEDEATRPFLESDGIDLGDPAALHAVLATTEATRPGGVYDGTRTTIHQGTITYAELYRTSPAFRDDYGRKPPTGRDAKTEVSWRLWIGKDQLVRRVQTSRTARLIKGRDLWVSRVVDARLTGWGAETDIPVPSADETAGRADWKNPGEKRPVS
ncbi:hypothetical protein ACFQBS_13860 [Planomonospora parontospora]|nr:hypothetical protein [Planomonospora parontospora]